MTRRSVVSVVATGVLAVGTIVGYLVFERRGAPEETLVDQAIAISDDRARFATSATAANSFAAIATLLMAETQDCAAIEDPPSPSCLAVSQGAAVAQSASVLARQCTSDGLAELRASQRAHLVAVSGPVSTERDLPPVPRLPTCR